MVNGWRSSRESAVGGLEYPDLFPEENPLASWTARQLANPKCVPVPFVRLYLQVYHPTNVTIHNRNSRITVSCD